MGKIHVTSVSTGDFSTEFVQEQITRIFESNHLLSLATSNSDGTPHINTAYFAGTIREIVIFTPPSTVHGGNVLERPGVSATIFDCRQPWGSELSGLQVFGEMHQLTGIAAAQAFRSYAGRYASLLKWTKAYKDVERAFESRFFAIAVSKYKVLDEASFGSENYITAQLDGA